MSGFRRLLAPLSFAISSTPVAAWQIWKRKPDIVLVVEPTLFAAPAALLAARMVGAKTVLHVQDLEVEAAFAVGHLKKGSLSEHCAKLFDRATTCAFDCVITISNRMRDRVAAKGMPRERIEVVRNWVDLDLIQPLAGYSAYREELGLRKNQRVALYSGNLGVKQGVRVVLQAAAKLAKRDNVVFVVAGDGPMRPTLEQAATELPNLRLLPFQPETRFSEFLGLADVHVLPQERGAADLLLPSKLGGMLASGKPIVVTAEQGTELAEFLGDACYLTPPGDADALARAIEEVTAQPADAEQRAARLSLAASLAKPDGLRAIETAITKDREPGAVDRSRRGAE
jgi:colanic acid biosynthesis glycosyl transferase WcaI